MNNDVTPEEEEAFKELEAKLRKENTCQHRWEESDFGKAYWSPGTYQYTCARCGKMGMVTLET